MAERMPMPSSDRATIVPPPSTTVLVTGACGFVASHVILELLRTTDLQVRGTVRSLHARPKFVHLLNMPGASSRLELVEADLLDAACWPAAVDGCAAVLHIASPYVLTVNDPLRDLVEPAERGTEHVLRAAIAAKIEHILVTSSIAAIADAPEHGKVFTEADWNTRSSLTRLPYYYSKVRAETKAWELVRAAPQPTRLVVLNPAMVIGPSMTNTLNESVRHVIDPLRGNVPALVQISYGLVDVRDVATAHVRALVDTSVHGRHILVADVWDMDQVVRFYRRRYPNAAKALPSLSAPNWAVSVLAHFKPQGPRQYLQANIGHGKYAFSNTKSIETLHMTYRPVEISLADTVQDSLQWGFIPQSKL
ncbi:Aste57867_18576 [Aphanomyces stellatus]|uniref:Aste57867_18576 protein n=1 Tax=Aphanomyces stellatus TaxID=120398 RepID=A0A485LAG7_9STRA|nr:hypothetical protein As57867_018514 [Aphanomyces stellatus]VFT95312.1 Aste57867_18576 [Aphanomyces stellatus]